MGRQRRDPPWTPSGILIKSLSFLGSEMHKISDGRRWRPSICPILCAMSFRARINIQWVAEGPTSLEAEEVSRCLSRLLLTICESLCGQGCPGVGSWGKASVDACSLLHFHFPPMADLHLSCCVMRHWELEPYPSRLKFFPGVGSTAQLASCIPSGDPISPLCSAWLAVSSHVVARVSPVALPGGAIMSKDFSIWKNYDCLSLSFCKTAWTHGKAERSSQDHQERLRQAAAFKGTWFFSIS